MTVDDAHSTTQSALDGGSGGEFEGLYGLKIAELNETERRHVIKALMALQAGDDALAVRSSFGPMTPPWEREVDENDE